ncbi:hypothetical protein, partial [Mesorhizobium sp. M0592]|uniref:hypothetical protein n=1 Tax=Mesorhizobium sp. M0592 TaxID=2956967 RepID=UPI003335A4B2
PSPVLRRTRKLSPMLSVHSVTYLSGSDTGHFSPYSDGEKEAGRSLGARPATLAIGETGDDSFARLRGEDGGSQMRGSADVRKIGLIGKVRP